MAVPDRHQHLPRPHRAPPEAHRADRLRTLDERRPDRSQQATLRSLGDERYADAWERGDVDGIVSMLAEDVALTMPTWYKGRAAAAGFLLDFAFAQRWAGDEFVAGVRGLRLVPASASGQVAFASYTWRDGAHVPMAIQVLTLRATEITEVAGFVMPEAFARFGLPDPL